MSRTDHYSTIHAAIRLTAKAHGIEGYATRVVLAIAEHGPRVRSDELESLLGEDGSAMRRALLHLYGRKLARGIGDGGGPRRPGVRSVVTLTAAGEAIAVEIQRRISAIETAKASEPTRAAA